MIIIIIVLLCYTSISVQLLLQLGELGDKICKIILITATVIPVLIVTVGTINGCIL